MFAAAHDAEASGERSRPFAWQNASAADVPLSSLTWPVRSSMHFPLRWAKRSWRPCPSCRAATLEPAGSFTVRVQGEDLVIPYRIYPSRPPTWRIIRSLAFAAPRSPASTRHHEGHVRQRYLKRIVWLPHAWITPFVVQLIGEYVVEILIDIQEALKELDAEGSPQRLQYGTFVADNPAFVELTAQRVVRAETATER